MENSILGKEDAYLDGYFHVLLKPDVFHRDILKDVLETLAEYGIKIYLFDIIAPNEKLLNVMYDSDFKWEYDYYHHNTRLFKLGIPSLSLVCKYNGDKNFKSIKGSSLPINAVANSIRYHFQVKDRCLNIIHIANTFDESFKELGLIYNPMQHENSLQEQELLSAQIVEKVHSILSNNNECYYDAIKEKAIERVKYRIACVLYFNGNISTINEMHNISDYDNYLTSDFKNLFNMCMLLDSTINSESTDNKVRFLEYFLVLFERNMIYISDMEKYILFGQCYYNSVNLSNQYNWIVKSS